MFFLVAGFPPEQFRLTFNKPAADLLLRGHGAVQFRRRGNEVQMLPGREGFEITERGSRGGVEIQIDKRVAELWGVLAASGAMFFSLTRDADGWISLEPSKTPPPRHVPSCRLWSGKVDVEIEADEHDPAWARGVAKSVAMVLRYEATGRIGAPPTGMVAAEADVAAIRNLAAQIGMVDGEKLSAARTAAERLLELLDA